MRRMIGKRTGFVILLTIYATAGSIAQDPPAVIIDVNLDVKHRIDTISEFDRSKFITIHSDHAETDWDGDNFTPNLRDHFLNGYDVYMGRSTGGITWVLKNQALQDPARPGHVSVPNMSALGLNSRNNYAAKTSIHPYEWRTKQVLGAQFHPFWPDGTPTNKGWALSQTDTAEEPFGTATGEYIGLYIKHFHGGNGRPFPPFVEIINEPLWELVTNGTTPPSNIFNFHNNVATSIRNIYPDVLIGGYTAAFPDFDVRNFDRWHERDKLFIDMSGDHMDFISIHLYDFPAKGGKQKYRKGSNIEATFDMMEHYSMLTKGRIIPFEVSEYGAQVHDLNNDPWTPYRDWLRLKSINSMVLSFMERPDKMLMTIPFTVVKAEWGRHDGIPYGPRLMRQAFEGEGETGNHWVYTEQVLFYQLWSDVKGTRVDSWSTDLDYLADAYVDENKAYVIVNNLEFNTRAIGLNTHLGGGNTLQGIHVKHLYLNNGIPVLESSDYSEEPLSYQIGNEGTMVIEYTFDQPIAIPDSSVEEKHYATSYLQPIETGIENLFQINGVTTGTIGEGVLRLGIGRDHGRSLNPAVLFNGSALQVPEDFRGGDQADRENFFGVIEIPVPYSLLQPDNSISVTFPDHGGHISSVTLQTFVLSREITRPEIPDRFNVSFTVLHEETGSAIEGARVDFDGTGFQTGPDGKALIDTVQSGFYQVEITAPGFKPWQTDSLRVMDNLHLTVELFPLDYQVSIEIREKDLDLPVLNAHVSSGSKSGTSNSEGKATLTLPLGNSEILITKSYFEDYTSEFMISKDTMIQVPLRRLFADVKFRVLGADGSTRERDAKVSLGDTAILTNALGLATFAALKVDTLYSYTITKSGYHVSSSELMIKKDTMVEVSLLVGQHRLVINPAEIKLYPVPPIEYLTVSWNQDNPGKSRVTILDITGSEVSNEIVKGIAGKNHYTLLINQLQHGIYFIRIDLPDRTSTSKFVINKPK